MVAALESAHESFRRAIREQLNRTGES